MTNPNYTGINPDSIEQEQQTRTERKSSDPQRLVYDGMIEAAKEEEGHESSS